MSRNLSHRVEAAVPVEDPALRARLKELLEILLTDNRQAWNLNPDGTWTQQYPGPGEPERGTHARLMELTRQRARRTEL
jgi:polyphosphate kinase